MNLIKIKGIFGFLQLEQNEPFRLCEPIITYSMSSLHGHTVRTQKAGSEGSPEQWSAPIWLHTSPVYTHPVFALSCPEVAVASAVRSVVSIMSVWKKLHLYLQSIISRQ